MTLFRPAVALFALFAFGAPHALAHEPHPPSDDGDEYYDDDESYGDDDESYDDDDESYNDRYQAPRQRRRAPAYRSRTRGNSQPTVRRSAPKIVVEDAPKSAFDRNFALGVFASRWSGDYESGGIGGKLRWEPFSMLGIELHAQVLNSGNGDRSSRRSGERFDVPLGFSLYVPIDLFWGLRARGIAGLCAMVSFGEDITIQETSSDDIMLGAHVGAGLEFSLGSRLSVFADAVYQTYVGHNRDLGGWSTAIGQELEQVDSFQATFGLAFHL